VNSFASSEIMWEHMSRNVCLYPSHVEG